MLYSNKSQASIFQNILWFSFGQTFHYFYCLHGNLVVQNMKYYKISNQKIFEFSRLMYSYCTFSTTILIYKENDMASWHWMFAKQNKYFGDILGWRKKGCTTDDQLLTFGLPVQNLSCPSKASFESMHRTDIKCYTQNASRHNNVYNAIYNYELYL